MNPPLDPAAEIARLRRRARFWSWFAGTGLVLTVLGYIYSRDPTFHHAPPAPQAHSSASISDRPEASEVSDWSGPPPSHTAYDTEAPRTASSNSLSLIRQRFAEIYPQLEIIPLTSLTSEGAYRLQLPGKYLQEAMSATIHAPGRVNGRQMMICDIFCIRDAARTGTDMNVAWACGIRLRSEAGSAFPADATLPFIVWPSCDPARAETGTISLRDAVNLCAPLCR